MNTAGFYGRVMKQSKWKRTEFPEVVQMIRGTADRQVETSSPTLNVAVA